jgi:hypothetical protein
MDGVEVDPNAVWDTISNCSSLTESSKAKVEDFSIILVVKIVELFEEEVILEVAFVEIVEVTFDA